ncbi:Clavaminate synthase-like protein [Gymnopus androsaceus JB14]|uniref:Clavaminate synthase-like protein n=1 Tax=Gymnopus androsaceus JB14 TaxID=1447944 RepID=A0A6A4I6F5_9AGAR|nr:Clavaminate synthase-like protein [Gymnopus androsaceus JB14]
MPSLINAPLPPVRHYEAAPLTKERLEYVDLPIIDLSSFTASADPDVRTHLVAQVRSAMAEYGFFYVLNHGLSTAQTERMFDIADIPFSEVDDDEKKKYQSKLKETGTQQGYKPRQYYHIDNGIRDQIEIYALNHDVNKSGHPAVLQPLLPEIERFAYHNHVNVLYPILRLLALGLDLSEDSLVELHKWEDISESYVRYPRSDEEEEKTNNLWLKGHTDIGSLTFLYSQPIAALQIRAKDGSWKWVKHIENAIVVNAGDAIEFLSGGLYSATIHRVVQPPADQRAYTRLGLFYFLKPLSSPFLQRTAECAEAPTMAEWRKGRTKSYGNAELKASAINLGVEEEYLNGVLIKHYV